MEQQTIQPIGSIQQLDEEGYIINDLFLDNMQPEYKVPLDEIIHLAKDRLGEQLHSVYIRGSVAKGKAIPEISDLDTMLIVHQMPSKELYQQLRAAREVIDSKYDFLNGIELPIYLYGDLKDKPKLQFLLKTQCLCVYGTDATLELPKFKLGPYAYAHASQVEQGINHLEHLEQWLEEQGGDQEENLKGYCAWIMKRHVRVGFELVMMREQYFTRDLYPCYAGFIKHYPEHQAAMYRMLELAVFPKADKEEIRKVTYALSDFLLEETAKLKE